MEDWIQLRLYFERREILSHWLKDNLWLVSLIGDAAIQSLRPPLCSAEVPVPMLTGDPVSCLVQRYFASFLIRFLLFYSLRDHCYYYYHYYSLGCVTRSLHKQLQRDSCATFATSHAKEMLVSRRICDWATDIWITHPPHMGSRRKRRAKPHTHIIIIISAVNASFI